MNPSTRPQPTRASLRGALALRDLHCRLCHQTADLDAVAVALRSIPPDAWTLFLAADCSALWLGRLLRERDLLRRLPPATRDVFLTAESVEMQRVLTARSMLRMLDDAARESGVRAVILKGGVAAVEPEWLPVDLGDVDVEVAAEDAERYWNALLARGWHCDSRHEVSVAEMAAHDAFMAMYPPGVTMNVDFHQRAPWPSSQEVVQDPLVPLHGFAALDRRRGASAVAALLRHAVIKHPHRRGHLRDVLLIAQYVRELADEERRTLVEHLGDDAYAPELGALYTQALDLAQGKAPRFGPETLRFVAAKYAMLIDGVHRQTQWFPAWRSVALVALERPPIRRSRYVTELIAALRLESASPLMRTARHRGLLPARAMWLLRLGYRAVLVAAVALYGPVLRLRARSSALTP